MKKTILALLIAGATVSSAFAADLPRRRVEYVPAPTPVVVETPTDYTWKVGIPGVILVEPLPWWGHPELFPGVPNITVVGVRIIGHYKR